MSRLIQWESLRFGQTLFLWLLVAPVFLLGLWCWRVVRRRIDTRRYKAARLVPVHERFSSIGELAFWLALIAAGTAFGLVHFASRAYAAVAGVMGVYLGALFLLQGSLLAPIVTHTLYDFVALLYVARRPEA